MNPYTKYNYHLNILSAVVLSPREQEALYMDSAGKNGFNIIYPFYQYGTYEEYKSKNAQYYIPGSSIKGAIGETKIMVDDIMVPGESISLRPLYKIQNIPEFGRETEDNGKIKAERFFPKIGVEMLRAGAQLEGELFSREDINGILSKAHMETIKRLKKWSERFPAKEPLSSNISKLADGEKDIEFERVKRNMNYMMNRKSNSFLILLGGYKGKLLSHVFEKEVEKCSVYVDYDTALPHGLVEIEL